MELKAHKIKLEDIQSRLCEMNFNEISFMWLSYGGKAIEVDATYIEFPSTDEMIEDIIFESAARLTYVSPSSN